MYLLSANILTSNCLGLSKIALRDKKITGIVLLVEEEWELQQGGHMLRVSASLLTELFWCDVLEHNNTKATHSATQCATQLRNAEKLRQTSRF